MNTMSVKIENFIALYSITFCIVYIHTIWNSNVKVCVIQVFQISKDTSNWKVIIMRRRQAKGQNLRMKDSGEQELNKISISIYSDLKRVSHDVVQLGVFIWVLFLFLLDSISHICVRYLNNDSQPNIKDYHDIFPKP